MKVKKIALVLGILVATNILVAQDGREQRKEKIQERIEEYKERLGLSDLQIEKIKEVRAKYKPDMEEIRQNEATSRAEKMRASADVIEKMEADLSGVLTAEQQEEWKAIKAEIREKKEQRRERARERKKGDCN